MADAAFVLPRSGREAEFLAGLADEARLSPWRKAALALSRGDPDGLPTIYSEIGAGPGEAFARLRAAEAFVREGRRAEADAELEQALAFWRAAGATAYVREGEALVARSRLDRRSREVVRRDLRARR